MLKVKTVNKIYEAMSKNQAKWTWQENFDICFYIIFDH